jgi:hypothetical protein
MEYFMITMRFFFMGSILCTLFMSPLSAGDKTSVTREHEEIFGKPKFNKFGIAYILYQSRWVAINRKQKVLYEVFNYDNGPDYLSEGLHRFIENGKMGFANERGKKVIPANYDFVYPFSEGEAEFCNQCVSVKMGEHSSHDRTKGIWGRINKKGKILK